MKRLFILSLCAVLHLHVYAQRNNLDYFVGQAINNSPLLKDYNNQVLSFSLDSQIIKAGLKPQVNGISNSYYAPVSNGWGYDPVIADPFVLNHRNFNRYLRCCRSANLFLPARTLLHRSPACRYKARPLQIRSKCRSRM